jgi:hypothetical protein
MVILKATSFLEGHKRDMGITCSITQTILTLIYITSKQYFFKIKNKKYPKTR